MSMTDPTADLLTRIRNGLSANHASVEARASKLSLQVARILKEQGYIEAFEVLDPDAEHPGARLTIRLRYTEGRQPVISGLRRVSRPGRRTYVDHKHIPKVFGGMGTAIISTSSGVMTGHDARKAGVGGEVVAEIW
jgi:small subunit ribosomal protein S8